MVESTHYYLHTPEAVWRGGCGECPLSSVHIRITGVDVMNRSGSEVSGEGIPAYTYIPGGIHCTDFPCCIPPSGTE